MNRSTRGKRSWLYSLPMHNCHSPHLCMFSCAVLRIFHALLNLPGASKYIHRLFMMHFRRGGVFFDSGAGGFSYPPLVRHNEKQVEYLIKNLIFKTIFVKIRILVLTPKPQNLTKQPLWAVSEIVPWPCWDTLFSNPIARPACSHSQVIIAVSVFQLTAILNQYMAVSNVHGQYHNISSQKVCLGQVGGVVVVGQTNTGPWPRKPVLTVSYFGTSCH